jgi:hypothetical protein
MGRVIIFREKIAGITIYFYSSCYSCFRFQWTAAHPTTNNDELPLLLTSSAHMPPAPA